MNPTSLHPSKAGPLCGPALALLFSLLMCALPGQAQEDRLALVGGTLIDGHGTRPIRNTLILVNDGRIESIAPMDSIAIPPGYEVISTEGMTVLPGLWDLHVHLLYNGHADPDHWFNNYSGMFGSVTMPASARQLLMAGITSVRDLAAPTREVLELRDKINAGSMPGPTIYTVGTAIMPGISSNRPHILAVTDADQARAETRALIEAGVDSIKVLGMRADSLPILMAIVVTAHNAGLKVTAHGRDDEEVRVGLAAGVDEFQHIGTASEEFPQDILDSIRARIAAGRPLYWSPTAGLDLNANSLANDPEFLDDPSNFLGMPDDLVTDVKSSIASASFVARDREVIATVKRKIAQLRELGVVMVSGSDMGTFGHPAAEATWRDLEAWVFDLGLSTLQAIKWATLDAATHMGVADEVGSIAPGKIADIIVVRGNPTTHFSTLRDPAIVIKHGRRVK